MGTKPKYGDDPKAKQFPPKIFMLTMLSIIGSMLLSPLVTFWNFLNDTLAAFDELSTAQTWVCILLVIVAAQFYVHIKTSK